MHVLGGYYRNIYLLIRTEAYSYNRIQIARKPIYLNIRLYIYIYSQL